MGDMDPVMKSILKSFLANTGTTTQSRTKATKTSSKTKRNSRKVSPITQRLRSIEVEYSLPKADSDTLRQARQLITDLWELHWDGEADLKDEARRLFEQAGLEMNK